MLREILESIDLKKYDTEDFQNRGGGYPKSGVPVGINATSKDLEFSFKNTSEKEAKRWVEKSSIYKEISSNAKIKKLQTWQDGDYDDDWVTVFLQI